MKDLGDVEEHSQELGAAPCAYCKTIEGKIASERHSGDDQVTLTA